jgi:hypothetical protein
MCSEVEKDDQPQESAGDNVKGCDISPLCTILILFLKLIEKCKICLMRAEIEIV